jgi:uncharacterized protein (TIGR00730 family)
MLCKFASRQAFCSVLYRFHAVMDARLPALTMANDFLNMFSTACHSVGANMSTGPFRETVISSNMTDRKAGLYERGDAFICLPGGLGTLEEAAEVMSWMQLGLHSKCICFLNTNGAFDGLWSWLKHAIDKKFVSGKVLDAIFLASTSAEAISYVQRFKSSDLTQHSIRKGSVAADWTRTEEAIVEE